MLRDRRPGDRQSPGDLTDRPRPVGQQFEDRPPGRIAQRASSRSSGKQSLTVSRYLPGRGLSRAPHPNRPRSRTMQPTSITDIRTIGVNVTDQEDAIAFYVATLGFEKRLDAHQPRDAMDRSRTPRERPPRSPSTSTEAPRASRSRALRFGVRWVIALDAGLEPGFLRDARLPRRCLDWRTEQPTGAFGSRKDPAIPDAGDDRSGRAIRTPKVCSRSDSRWWSRQVAEGYGAVAMHRRPGGR